MHVGIIGIRWAVWGCSRNRRLIQYEHQAKAKDNDTKGVLFPELNEMGKENGKFKVER